MFKPEEFFNKDNPLLQGITDPSGNIWDGIKQIRPYIEKNISPNIALLPLKGPLVEETAILENGARVYAGAYINGDNIEIQADAIVEPGAYIGDWSIIGPRTVVRHGAYIRGNLLSGPDCVIGHCTEIKNSCLLGNSKAGHFAYIGDSILGDVNLGAGTKLANLKLSGSEIKVKAGEKSYPTGLRKFGAILADGSQTGCNSVTSPGTIFSRGVFLYPNATARGYYPKGTIIKLRQELMQENKD